MRITNCLSEPLHGVLRGGKIFFHPLYPNIALLTLGESKFEQQILDQMLVRIRLNHPRQRQKF